MLGPRNKEENAQKDPNSTSIFSPPMETRVQEVSSLEMFWRWLRILGASIFRPIIWNAINFLQDILLTRKASKTTTSYSVRGAGGGYTQICQKWPIKGYTPRGYLRNSIRHLSLNDIEIYFSFFQMTAFNMGSPALPDHLQDYFHAISKETTDCTLVTSQGQRVEVHFV